MSTTNSELHDTATGPSNFVREIVIEDLKTNKFGGRVHTRFPPEPNGYLHIGHAKSICLNFGLAREYGGKCNLRFDDTNPAREEQEHVDSIMHALQWLRLPLGNGPYGSGHFQQVFHLAHALLCARQAHRLAL